MKRIRPYKCEPGEDPRTDMARYMLEHWEVEMEQVRREDIVIRRAMIVGTSAATVAALWAIGFVAASWFTVMTR